MHATEPLARRGAGRHIGAVVAVFLSPAYRADRPPPRIRPTGTTATNGRVALALVAASGVFLVLAAALGAPWALAVAIACALIAAPLAAYTE